MYVSSCYYPCIFDSTTNIFCSFHCSIYNAENNAHFPNGHETIAVTTDGRSGDLGGGGRYPVYLTVKRGFTHGYNSSTAITKLAIIVEGKVGGTYVQHIPESKNMDHSNLVIKSTKNT